MYDCGEEEIAALASVIRSKRLFRHSVGPNGEPSQTTQFEREWAEKIGARHALAVSSGTAALICGLVGLGIGPGDEVIVPGYTFISTALAPLAVGAVPVLAEIDAGLMLDPADVEQKITARTKAIIPVHMLGHVVNLDPLMKIAHAHRLKVLEDACQCDGGSYRGKRVGTHGDAGAFSFNYFKIISSSEGGALVTDDLVAYQRARIYQDSGAAWRADAKELAVPYFAGVNYRSDELRSAFIRIQANRLDGILGRLRQRYRRLRELLQGQADIKCAPVHDLAGIAGICLLLRLESRSQAQAFAKAAAACQLPVSLPYDSGRHVYVNWAPLMERRGAHHPACDPIQITDAGRAQKYTPDALPRTLEHLARTVSINIELGWTEEDLDTIGKKLAQCAQTGIAASAVK